MKAVVQRVKKAFVEIDGAERREIAAGLVILAGIGPKDSEADIEYIANKISGLRIFPDESGKMNLSVRETGGDILVVSQFTLYGNTRKGKRPDFTDAAPPEKAKPLYEAFVEKLKFTGLKVRSGEFGAYMVVEIHNDGPVTLIIESPK